MRSTHRSAACWRASASPCVVTPLTTTTRSASSKPSVSILIRSAEARASRPFWAVAGASACDGSLAGTVSRLASSTSRGATDPLSETSTPASAGGGVTAASRAAAVASSEVTQSSDTEVVDTTAAPDERRVAAVASDTAASEPGSTTSATRRSWSTPASRIGLVSAM